MSYDTFVYSFHLLWPARFCFDPGLTADLSWC